MFQSATLKLTAWYAGILMIISLMFSLIIFEISTKEVNSRLVNFQGLLQNHLVESFTGGASLLRDESARAATALAVQLIYINVGVLLIGTTASYFLARRTLKPIEQAHEAQVRFVSDASHELRTPLSIMKSEIELVLRGSSSTKEELVEILESNLEEVNSLSTMSETLLKMSTLEGDVPMKVTKLKATTEEVIARFKLKPSRLEFTAINSPSVRANGDLIKELLAILIDNALKYSPDDSLITVTLRGVGSNVELSITNEGKGIAKKDLANIFDRFYRADRSRTAHQAERGFGLGLSLAKQIAEIHDGHISVLSAPNKKTTFTLTLPKYARRKS